MSPINFSLYEELPEPIFLQMQRREAEEKEAKEKKVRDVCNTCLYPKQSPHCMIVTCGCYV